MEIKKNISVQDRVDFVNFVVNSCEIDGRHVHALFDFVWRTAVVMWFTDALSGEYTQDEMCDYVYSKEGIDIVNDPDIAEVLSGLYEACTNEIKDRREEFMVIFKDMSHPDPLDRIAVSFDEISKTIKTVNDPAVLIDIAKKAGLTGKKSAGKKPKKQSREGTIDFSELKKE